MISLLDHSFDFLDSTATFLDYHYYTQTFSFQTSPNFVLFCVNLSVPGSNLTKIKLFYLIFWGENAIFNTILGPESLICFGKWISFVFRDRNKNRFSISFDNKLREPFLSIGTLFFIEIVWIHSPKKYYFKASSRLRAWAEKLWIRTFENIENIDWNCRINDKINFIVEFQRFYRYWIDRPH